MAHRPTVHNKMRIYHRYLGFFLAGIMAVYAISGIVLVFRTTDFLKNKKTIVKQLEPGLTSEKVGQAIRFRDLKFDSTTSAVKTFKQGTYNSETGEVSYSIMKLPVVLEKLTNLHKATSNDPLYYLNIFFGASLLFFVISTFWMFLPKTTIFKKGLIFTGAGLILTLIMIFWD